MAAGHDDFIAAQGYRRRGLGFMSSKSRRQSQASGPSQRQLRVGEALRHALSEILMREDFFDPDLANVSITISEISVSPDLSNARVYTMPLGGVNVETVLPALNR